MASAEAAPAGSPMMTTPPTPSGMYDGLYSPEAKHHQRHLPSSSVRLPLSLVPQTPAGMAGCSQSPALCTPANYNCAGSCTPPSELRRKSLVVPVSERLVKVAKGSGVSVYRLDRSPREGRPRSPWVIKKTDISPILVRPASRTAPAASRARPPPSPLRVSVGLEKPMRRLELEAERACPGV